MTHREQASGLIERANPYEGTCPICDGQDPECDWDERAKRFADAMVGAGVRFEKNPDWDATYTIDPKGPDYRYLGPKCCADMERDLDGTCANCGDHQPPAKPFVRPALEAVVNRGRKVERDEPAPFRRYSIPAKARPGEVPCPYCVKRPIGPKGLRDHCRAVHPDKPEAR